TENGFWVLFQQRQVLDEASSRFAFVGGWIENDAVDDLLHALVLRRPRHLLQLASLARLWFIHSCAISTHDMMLLTHTLASSAADGGGPRPLRSTVRS